MTLIVILYYDIVLLFSYIVLKTYCTLHIKYKYKWMGHVLIFYIYYNFEKYLILYNNGSWNHGTNIYITYKYGLTTILIDNKEQMINAHKWINSQME